MPKPDHLRTQPLTATRATPGTLEKVNVLCARQAAGQMLWHPDDAGMDELGVARVEILNRDYMAGKGGQRHLGWLAVDEKAYRRRNHGDDFFEIAAPPAARRRSLPSAKLAG